MFNVQSFRELLPMSLKCKKDYRDGDNNVFLGYDENNQVYTITKDNKGCLHVLERHLEEEEKAIYAAINSIGRNMTRSSEPIFPTKHQSKVTKSKVTRSTPARKEIVLAPCRDKLKRGYESITIIIGNEKYSITNSNGSIQLIGNGEVIQIDSTEKAECLSILKKPLDVSITDRLRIGRITHTEDEKLRQLGECRPEFVRITPKIMAQWDDVR